MSNSFQPFIQAVGRGQKLKRDLTYQESKDAFRMILQREATDIQVGAFLIAQRVKGEGVDEIRGLVDLMREEFMVRIQPQVENLLDLACPYNGKTRTAQLAPAVALTLLAAGVPSVLHGRRRGPHQNRRHPRRCPAPARHLHLAHPRTGQRADRNGRFRLSQYGALQPCMGQFAPHAPSVRVENSV